MSPRNPEICIVGAGMSGLLMGIRLEEAGIDSFRIYEKGASIGGTWRENTYPGLTCDVPSFFYSYSFEQNLDWSRRFSPGPEILAYFERIAEKYDLLPHITFDEKITSARYEDGRWAIETASGEKTTADILITARRRRPTSSSRRRALSTSGTTRGSTAWRSSRVRCSTRRRGTTT